MRIQRTQPDASHRGRRLAADATSPTDSHWWDGSQIYGSDEAFATRAPVEGGRQAPPRPRRPAAARPRAARRPHRRRGQLLARARAPAHALHPRAQRDLRPPGARSIRPGRTTSSTTAPASINAALMAKIHTVEWTPAIIAHPTTRYAMRANWYGILGKRLRKAQLERGARRDPRLADRPPRRPLLARPRSSSPSTGCTRSSRTTSPSARSRRTRCSRSGRSASSARSTRARGWTSSVCRTRSTRSGSPIPARSRCTTTRASSSTSSVPTGRCMDLAATDILRVRERGVPRYNEFRRLFHLKPAASFEELTDEPGVGGGAAAGLRRRRARRPDGRAVRRAAAEGLRLQRHGLPRLHPDGLAAPQERPLLHARLQRRDVHPGGTRLDRGEHA